MQTIKFIIFYLYKIIIKNPGKLILISISIILWHFSGALPEKKFVLDVSDSLHLDGKYQYVYKKISENTITYNIYESEDPLSVKNGKIEYLSYNDTNIVLWILFGICGVLSIISLVLAITDSDCGWDFDEAFDYALSWFVNSNIDDSDGQRFYRYYAFGKLLRRSSYLNEDCYVGSLRNLRKLPDYEPKEEKRDRLITNLLKNNKNG